MMVTTIIVGAVVPLSPLNIKAGDGSATTKESPLRRAADIARQHGVDSMFLESLLENSNTTFVESAVKINVTNYASSPDYSHNHNTRSVLMVKKFMDDHDSLLSSVTTATGVPAEVVAAILWVESKCGTILGKYHVPSVYLSVALAAETEHIDRNIEAVAKGDTTNVDALRDNITKRATKKVTWAMAQLRALDTMQRRGTINVLNLYGSWAGAFGWSQFLPSSYLSWAVDGNADGEIDLYSVADAAHSVGNYLRSNGWSDADSSQRAAVHHYNNSTAYVDAVLTLTKKVR